MTLYTEGLEDLERNLRAYNLEEEWIKAILKWKIDGYTTKELTKIAETSLK